MSGKKSLEKEVEFGILDYAKGTGITLIYVSLILGNDALQQIKHGYYHIANIDHALYNKDIPEDFFSDMFPKYIKK